MAIDLDKEKYIRVLQTEGLSKALSVLHSDIERLEYECFEGREGYQPQVFEDLKKFRDFSRELWSLNHAMANGGSAKA